MIRDGGKPSYLCTVCARGGSKGVPGKNIRMIAGRPLFAWTLDCAKAVGLFDRIVVSSDDPDILSLGDRLGADLCLRRRDELASDRAGKVPVIVDAVERAQVHFTHEFDVIVDLDVTSPLRHESDILGAVDMMRSTGATNVITGTPSRRSPYFNMVERDEDGSIRLVKTGLRDTLRRQDAPVCYDMNASVYVWDRERFLNNPKVFYEDTVLYEMPEERSIDIDTELDFFLVEALLSRSVT
ncbi:MAG: flagellar modification protein B [Alphaproteobacteria bacterium]|nr:flagellar modification protein B [Alphaproteobacteria bacterium]